MSDQPFAPATATRIMRVVLIGKFASIILAVLLSLIVRQS